MNLLTIISIKLYTWLFYLLRDKSIIKSIVISYYSFISIKIRVNLL